MLTQILFLSSIAVVGCTKTVAPTTVEPAGPIAPVAHPAYLTALTDLRAARSFLESPSKNPAVTVNENDATREIDATMKEIHDATIDDGKLLEDHPPVDTGTPWSERLQRALELVESARRDVTSDEDNGFARGLKHRTLDHLDLAARALEQGIVEADYQAPQAPHDPAPRPACPAARCAYAFWIATVAAAHSLRPFAFSRSAVAIT